MKCVVVLILADAEFGRLPRPNETVMFGKISIEPP
jgi:hypothetical protein